MTTGIKPSFFSLVDQQYLTYQLALFEFSFQGLYFLLFLKFCLTEWLTGLELVIIYLNGKKLPAFPAPVRSLIA